MARTAPAKRTGLDGGVGGVGAAESGVDIKAELDKLAPEQVEMFVRALELAMRKRRIMLFGYLTTLLAVVAGQLGAVLIWANREPGTFIGWIFLVPIALAGLILVGTARLVRRIKPRP
jgi:hypothetical protein